MDSTNLGQLVGVYSIPLPNNPFPESDMSWATSKVSSIDLPGHPDSNPTTDGSTPDLEKARHATASQPRVDDSIRDNIFIRSAPPSRATFIGDAQNEVLPTVTERILLNDLTLSPLLLCGPSGVGKTVLARSLIEHATTVASDLIQETSRNSAVSSGAKSNAQESPPTWLEMQAADFARLISQAYETNTIEHFREKFAELQGMLLDNLQELEGKPKAQYELRLLMDRFEAKQHWMFITSNKIPTQFEHFDPALASRLLRGLSVTLQPPGPMARRQIIPNEVDRLQLRMDPEAIEYLIENSTGTVPQIVEILNRLVLKQAHRNRMSLQRNSTQTNHQESSPPSIGGAEESLRDWRDARPSTSTNPFSDVINHDCEIDWLHRISLEDVIAVMTCSSNEKPTLREICSSVSREFGLRSRDLQSQSRKQAIVRARGVAMLLIRVIHQFSLDEIGKNFGGRDHTTVLHALRKTQNQLQQDSELSLNLKSILEVLRLERIEKEILGTAWTQPNEPYADSLSSG